MKDHGSQEETDAFCPPINRSCETASLPRKMEVEVQFQQMVEHVASDLPDGFLCYLCKDCVPKFLEESSAYPSCAV